MLRFSVKYAIDIIEEKIKVRHFGGDTITHEEFREKIKKSPEKAHRELFEKYCNYVYNIVFNRLRSCASKEDIEECVCDVFADVYVYYDSSRDVEGELSGFIGTIARRKSGEIFKKSVTHLTPVSLDDEIQETVCSSLNIENESEKHSLQGRITDSIISLGEPDSTIVFQKYYYGRSSKEIAKMVSLTPENVRMRSSRAVKKLKEILGSEI